MVVHRDLKPENILLSHDNSVKLADFGLSNMMKDGQFLKTSCGSPNYAAPEVISGQLYAGPEVDVWSCGVILYAILCGSLPFDDENIRNLFRKIKNGNYNVPSFLSDGAADLIRRMLIVDPVKRIKISDIRQHTWFRTKLPKYLQLSVEQHIETQHMVDLAVVESVAEMLKVPQETVLEAITLSQEQGLLTSRKMAHLTDLRLVAVAYNLLLDKRHRQMHWVSPEVTKMLEETSPDSAAPRKEETKVWLLCDSLSLSLYVCLSLSVSLCLSLSLSVSLSSPSPSVHVYLTPSLYIYLSLSLALKQIPSVLKEELAPDKNLMALTESQKQQVRSRKSMSSGKRQWYLGLYTNYPPSLVLQELCRTLQSVGFVRFCFPSSLLAGFSHFFFLFFFFFFSLSPTLSRSLFVMPTFFLD